MITDHFKSRGYQILVQRPDAASFWSPIDGTAQFLYKDFLISMSTAGRSRGACMSPVCVFMPGNNYQDVAKDGFSTVQDAITWVDIQSSLDVAFILITDPLRDTTSTYAQAFRKFLLDVDMDSVKFNTRIDNFVKTHAGVVDKAKLIQSLANVDMSLSDFSIAMTVFNSNT